MIQKIRRLLVTFLDQRLKKVQVAFPAIVEEYIQNVPQSDGTEKRGILTARITVRPKWKQLDGSNREKYLGRLIAIPLARYKIGPFMVRIPYVKGDEVVILCSQRQLHKLILDDDFRRTESKELHTLEGAMVMPTGLRMESDPLLPDEALDSYYIAVVNAKNEPIFKWIVTPEGELHVWATKIVEHVKPGRGLTAPEKEGSSTAGARYVETNYKEGITEPQFYKSEDFIQTLAGEFIPEMKNEPLIVKEPMPETTVGEEKYNTPTQ